MRSLGIFKIGSVLLSFMCISFTNISLATTASFQGLGDLSGGGFESMAFGISGVGSVVVGQSKSTSGLEAFMWTSDCGMVPLGDLAGGQFNSRAQRASYDGSVVFVTGYSDSGTGLQAFRWQDTYGNCQSDPVKMESLGYLPSDNRSIAYGVSSDGSVVVGAGSSEAFRWTSDDGMVGLGYLSGDSSSAAYGITPDGSVVVGQSGNRACLWRDGGVVPLGACSPSHAIDVSTDGTVAVGRCSKQAFRWTSGSGSGLGYLPGYSYESEAHGVSSDGSVVVGTSNQPPPNQYHGAVFIWDEYEGMPRLRNLQVVLEECGLDLTGWQLHEGRGVSDDGLTIVGYGTNPDGNTEAWIATIPPFNQPPIAICQDVTVEAGLGCVAAASIDNGSYDPDGDAITITQNPPGPYLLGETEVTLTVTDDPGASDTCTATVIVVDTTPPAIVVTAVGPLLVKVGQTVNFDAVVGDECDPDPTVEWHFGDGNPISTDNPTTHTYDSADIYTVTLTVTDTSGSWATEEFIVVVYDPTGGFVTGGGWIDSPEGAYKPDPSLTGKANFGFVSKYKKGATVPTGNTEFVFKTADLNFHSSSYQWLVVNQNDTNAQFKGSGTINGDGDYKFMLWAGDGPDTFRIKIWTEDDEGNETDVYDNGFNQEIGGGSIVIHTK